MDEQKALKEFQERIGYQFKDEKLLYEALSHSSFANENKKARNSNERLEFLGDSVLSIVVSDHIFEHYKHMPEGELTKMRASLVCEKALFEFSKKIELGKYIFLGKGEEITDFMAEFEEKHADRKIIRLCIQATLYSQFDRTY